MTGDAQQQEVARRVATLPMRMGGLGLRSARRMAPAACWASWADAMAMIDGRLPQIADLITAALEFDEAPGCLGELQRAAGVLDRCGFVGRSSLPELRGGARPPAPADHELGEWQHGWQFHANFSFEGPQFFPSHPAHLRSHCGLAASEVFCGAPTSPKFTLVPSIFRTALLERLRLPLDVTDVTCTCGGRLDSLGRHRGASFV